MNHRLFFGNLNALDLIEFLDAALYLFRLGGLGTETVDEGFKVLYLDALVSVSGYKLCAPLVFLT